MWRFYLVMHFNLFNTHWKKTFERTLTFTGRGMEHKKTTMIGPSIPAQRSRYALLLMCYFRHELSHYFVILSNHKQLMFSLNLKLISRCSKWWIKKKNICKAQIQYVVHQCIYWFLFPNDRICGLVDTTVFEGITTGLGTSVCIIILPYFWYFIVEPLPQTNHIAISMPPYYLKYIYYILKQLKTNISCVILSVIKKCFNHHQPSCLVQSNEY